MISAKSLLLTVSMSAALGGCAQFYEEPLAKAGPPNRCEDAVAEGMSTLQGEAKHLAREGVRHQLADARGNLLAQGLHRIRLVERDVSCKPHTLGLGLVKCTAMARLCGR